MFELGGSFFGPAFQAGSTVMSMLGKSRAADAMLEVGKRKQAMLDAQAAQLEINAGQQVAAGQRSAMEDQRQARLAQSRALAIAAASGGGASDPTIINLMAKLAGEGSYRSMVDIYQGQEKARTMNDQARMDRYSGQVAMTDAETAAQAKRAEMIPTLLSGAATMYSRFGEKSDPAKKGFGDTVGTDPRDIMPIWD